MTLTERLERLNTDRVQLIAKRRLKVRQHGPSEIVDQKLRLLTTAVLKEEIEMTDTVTVERKLYELDVIVDDLASLAHSPEGAKAIAASNIEGVERRLRHLRFDLQALQAAE